MDGGLTNPKPKPLCPPLWLLPNQWRRFEEAGYDMRYAKRTPMRVG
jgi:hypothetical protein